MRLKCKTKRGGVDVYVPGFKPVITFKIFRAALRASKTPEAMHSFADQYEAAGCNVIRKGE